MFDFLSIRPICISFSLPLLAVRGCLRYRSHMRTCRYHYHAVNDLRFITARVFTTAAANGISGIVSDSALMLSLPFIPETY